MKIKKFIFLRIVLLLYTSFCAANPTLGSTRVFGRFDLQKLTAKKPKIELSLFDQQGNAGLFLQEALNLLDIKPDSYKILDVHNAIKPYFHSLIFDYETGKPLRYRFASLEKARAFLDYVFGKRHVMLPEQRGEGDALMFAHSEQAALLGLRSFKLFQDNGYSCTKLYIFILNEDLIWTLQDMMVSHFADTMKAVTVEFVTVSYCLNWFKVCFERFPFYRTLSPKYYLIAHGALANEMKVLAQYSFAGHELLGIAADPEKNWQDSVHYENLRCKLSKLNFDEDEILHYFASQEALYAIFGGVALEASLYKQYLSPAS
ncbi:hypothetical protein K2X40_00585 [Candidatus Babeliales bacterium]|nr:hypothetical protein [Candidatus Babeliales bacterium]